MNFSGSTTIKAVAEETPDELSTWHFDIVIFVYMCVTSLKIVCPQGIILSQQGVIFKIPISNISALSLHLLHWLFADITWRS